MKRTNLQAIRDSIRHWMLDIRRPLKNGDTILFLADEEFFVWSSSHKIVPCDGEDCDLCKINDRSDCTGCPLEKNGMSCEKNNSPYNIFYNLPNLKSATGMVNALVNCYWAEVGGEND